MLDLSVDMRKRPLTTTIRAARMSPWPVTVRKDNVIMTHAALSNRLSQDELDIIQATADVWRSRGYGATADNLLVVAGLATPAPQPSVLPQNVYSLSTFRARRLAVS